ncbi:hypothetical protein Ae201684P_016270 [Aphanomyces euteiches]|nr:hypothetical protein Ae201684P_016270 [Aphanomyces euteiches]
MGNAWGTTWLRSTEERAWHAAKEGNLETIQAVCTTPSIMEWRENERGRTPLIMACANGHVACVEWLHENNVDLYGRDYRGNTPLHYACEYGQPEVVAYLLREAECTPYPLNAKGQSALEVAREEYVVAKQDGDSTTLLNDLSACISQLESRCSLYQGWLNARAKSLLSNVVRLSVFQSWQKHYAIVLRTPSSSVVELSLYSVDDNDERSSVPSSSLLVHVVSEGPAARYCDGTTSWRSYLGSKPFGFEVQGTVKTTSAGHSSQLESFQLAALDQVNLDDWVAIFNTASTLHDLIVTGDLQFHTHDLGRVNAYASGRPSRQDHATTSAVPSTVDAMNPPPPPEEDGDDDNEDDEDENTSDDGDIEVAQPLFRPPRRGSDDNDGRADCIVCLDARPSTVCVPCGHNVLCMRCATTIMSSTPPPLCPVCRQRVQQVIKLYRL